MPERLGLGQGWGEKPAVKRREEKDMCPRRKRDRGGAEHRLCVC